MKRYKPYFQTVDLHSPEALLYHRDFIQQMNMKYIQYSMQRLGINQSFDNLVLFYDIGCCRSLTCRNGKCLLIAHAHTVPY